MIHDGNGVGVGGISDGHAYSYISDVHLLAPVFFVENDIRIIFTFHFNWKHFRYQKSIEVSVQKGIFMCRNVLLLLLLFFCYEQLSRSEIGDNVSQLNVKCMKGKKCVKRMNVKWME